MRRRSIDNRANIYNNKIVTVFFAMIVVRLILVLVAQTGYFSLLTMTVLGLFSIVICIFSNKKYRQLLVSNENLCMVICTMYLVIVYLITNYLHKDTVFVDLKINIFLLVVTGLYIYIEYFCTPHKKKTMLIIYFVCLVVSLVATIYVELVGGGDVVRDTAKGAQSEDFGFVYGGYDFIYASLIIFVAILTFMKQEYPKISKQKRLILYGILLLCVAAIVLSNYTTAFILMGFALIFCLMPDDFRKYLLIIVLLLIFRFYYQFFIDTVNKISFLSELTKARINNGLLQLAGIETDETFLTGKGQRFDRILWTWEIIKRYPVFGLYAHGAYMRGGGHTQWIDDCGRYGSIYIFIFLLYWANMLKRIHRTMKQTNRNTIVARNAFLFFLILGFMNPIGMPVMSGVLLVCVPFSEYLFLDKKFLTPKEEPKAEST